MTKIALYGFLVICVSVNGMCMLDFGHLMKHVLGLPDLLSFYMNLHWSNVSRCGLACGVSRDGAVLALILMD
jgi:hypothetical protein